MHFKKRLAAVLALVCVTAATIYGSTLEMTGADTERTGLSLFDRKETLYFWYSDDTMTDFINSAAVSFGEQNNARVIPQLVADSEYLEAVNEASLHSEQVPDAYIISNDSLEKAYLAGLASQAQDSRGVLNGEHFPQAALSAVTYQGKYVAYPFYYETSALVYNETYLYEWAKQQAEKELANAGQEEGVEVADGSAEGAQLDEAALAEKTEQYFANAIPATVDDILNIADTFDVPAGVEGVMKWDVSDIFYNYWIVGRYLSAGGDSGDDRQLIDINNPETIQCLQVYQALNQFFSIEPDSITYESVVQDFIDGKVVFTIATTDVVQKLEQAKADGSFAYDYGIAVMPAVTSQLDSRSLSVTGTVVINGYSGKKELANEFAAFLTDGYTENLYARTGRVSANRNANTDNGALQIFMEEYSDSIPLCKMIETSNLWIQLEILFSKVWNGEDAGTLVQELAAQIQLQTGNDIQTGDAAQP